MLPPDRLDAYSSPDLAFARSRRDTTKLLDARLRAFNARLAAAGVEDRAVLGIPEPIVPTPLSDWAVLGRAVGEAWGNITRGLADFGRGLEAGIAATNPTDRSTR